MEGHLVKLRQFLIDGRCLDESLLLKPTLIVQPPAEDDEDNIEHLESINRLYKRVYNEILIVILNLHSTRIGPSMDLRSYLFRGTEELLHDKRLEKQPTNHSRWNQ
jgi:hypothetical protein